MSRFGLEEPIIIQLQKVFSQFPSVEKALLYGSRAKGNFRYNSDIDLSLLGDISYDDLLKIELKIDDLFLPYKIDLSIFQNIENVDLKEHIQRVGIEFYTKKN